MNKIKAGIIGGTGYTGIELLRILARHPDAEIICITSRTEVDQPVEKTYPSLRGSVDLVFCATDDDVLKQCDIVFSATPNGVAMQHAREYLSAGVKMIDLAADFRLKDVRTWEKWYGMEHACPELIDQAIYGLPELHRDQIRNANLVANPGCYPTTVQLGFLPLIEAGVVAADSLIADAKSGVSGAGRKAALGTSFSEVGESFKAYNVPGHRHLPEIRQGIESVHGGPVELVFTPHLLPQTRGIHATLYATITKPEADLQELFEKRYENEPFVDVMPAGSHPDTASVRGSNTCRIAVHRPQNGNTVVVLAVEDNLVKGASGQAVQNMNLMFGLEETAGLEHIALVP
jgi:N-acetyl-gamma-glutamyl-phosphate reductase